MNALIPRQSVPALSVPTLDGTQWTLAEQNPEQFSLIAFYRGLHCPKCKVSLGDLERKLKDFEALGVEAIAISSDTKDRAEQAREDWGLEGLGLGYDLSIEQARAWGLYISTSLGTTSAGFEEPALFNEPGVFLVRPDGTLYLATVQSMPFVRPHYSELLQAVKFVVERGYPARGEA
jgi:peroxiredoxin